VPVVPSLEAPQVQTEPLPGRAFPRVSDEISPASFGSGLAQGIEEVGAEGAHQEAILKSQNDQLRVIDANTQLEAAKTSMLYGENGKGGAFSLHGVDAINMPASILPHYDEAAQKLASGLTPDQQRMFQAHIALGRNELNTSLNRYEFEESNRLADAVYDNGVKQTATNAALAWRDPSAITKARLDMKALVSMQADREGWDPTTRAQATLGAMGQLHSEVVNSMTEQGEVSKARSYLLGAAAQGEIDPKAGDSMLRMLNAQEEHKLAMDDKIQRDNSNVLLKSAILMSQKGQLTPQWIEQHHATWEPQAYEYAYNLLSGKGAATDPHVFAPLLNRALAGEDVSKDAQAALYRGSLSLSDYKGIVEKADQPRKGYVARGADYISQSLKPNPMVPDPAGQRSLANAMDDWRQWTQDHGDASEEQARTAYRNITDHYQVVASDKVTLFNAVPLHLVGTRTQPDLNATWAATKAARAAGELSEAEYQRQATLILQWQAATARKPKVPTQ